MAVQFHPLPVEVFNAEARPFIARLNRELLDLFGLEGTIRQPIKPSRSDATIARRSEVQVDVSRITPDIMPVVSGSSTIVGTPALVFGTVNTTGSTNTVVSVNSAVALFGTGLPSGLSSAASAGSSAFAARADHVHAAFGTGLPAALAEAAATGTSAFAARGDHVHIFPPTLRTTANGFTVSVTDDATDVTMRQGRGTLIFSPPSAFNAATGWNFRANDATAMTTAIAVQLDSDSGNRTGLAPSWSAGGISNTTIRCWDAQYSSLAGVHNTATMIGYDTSVFSFSPSSGSTVTSAYCYRGTGPVINNNNSTWPEVAGLLLEAPRRLITNPTVTLAGTIIAECPTISGTTQIGIYLRQRTAQQTATNRYGILIDAQNSGTSRYSIFGESDMAWFSGPLRIGGRLAHEGTQIGFFGNSTIAQNTGWSASGFTTTKTLNGASYTLDNVMSTLNTLITHLVNRGDLAA